MKKIRPFLKWPGGKYRLIDEITSRLPQAPCYAEPFLGSGAIFLNTDYAHYHLNDINPDLITLYKALIANPDEFVRHCQQFFKQKYNRSVVYYDLRNKFNQLSPGIERSALFIYLNRHGYNGLCRYNSRGIFNVPFGRYDKPYFPEQEMCYFAEKAQKAHFECTDFVSFLFKLNRKAVIYCDPPYAVLTKTAHFTRYFQQPFCEQQQHQLAELADTLSNKHYCVLISNHDTPFTREIYHSAELIPFSVTRSISCKSDNRIAAKEILAIYR